MTITRAASITVGLVAVAAALAGCSSVSPSSAPASQSVTTVVVTRTTSPSSPAPTSTTGSSGSPSDGGASDRCRAAQLAGSLTPAQGGASAGSAHYELTLTNTGSSACTTGGFPGVSFVGDGTGTQLGAPARREGSSGAALRLAPGQSASSDLTVVQAGNHPDCSPQTADGLRVYPPDDRDSLFVRTTGLTACRSDAGVLRVGPLH